MRANSIIFNLVVVALVALLNLVCGAEASAQYLRERGLVREGNRQFEKLNYRSSLNRYNEALEYDSLSYEAMYNRANSYQRLRMSESADSTLNAETAYANYEAIVADTLLSDVQRAEVLRNLGESLVEGEKYEAALNAFRKSMLLNPDDAATKYNYVLTKRIVDQKRSAQQQQQNDQSNDPQQNDQNQQQDNNQQQNNEDQQQNNNNEDQQQNQDQQNEGDQEQDQQQQQEQQQQEQQQQMSKENAEQMLQAAMQDEKDVQEKVKKMMQLRGRKLEKDW